MENLIKIGRVVSESLKIYYIPLNTNVKTFHHFPENFTVNILKIVFFFCDQRTLFSKY